MQAAASLARRLPNNPPFHTSANCQRMRYDEAPAVLTGLIVFFNSSNNHLTVAYTIAMASLIITEHVQVSQNLVAVTGAKSP